MQPGSFSLTRNGNGCRWYIRRISSQRIQQDVDGGIGSWGPCDCEWLASDWGPGVSEIIGRNRCPCQKAQQDSEDPSKPHHHVRGKIVLKIIVTH
jgi:hypothetical protein